MPLRPPIHIMVHTEPLKPAPTGSIPRPRQQLGKDGLSYFTGLIGGPPLGWTIERAMLEDAALVFSLVKGSRRLEFAITPDISRDRRVDSAAWGIALSLRNAPEDLPEEDCEVERAVAAGIATTTFAEFIVRLKRDSLLYSDPDGSRVPSRFERYYRVVDHTPDFWKFVYPKARFLEQEVCFGQRYAKISHATLECRVTSPQLTAAPLRYFADDCYIRREGGSISVDTAISEADVLKGRTQEILGRTLNQVAREEKPAFIHLMTTCLPELIGDNPTPFIGRIETELGVPVLWTSKTRPSGPVYEAVVERLLGEAKFAANRDPRATLLAGIPSAEAQAELASLCEALGLRVVGALFPSLDFRQAPEMGVASSVIWLNPVGWERIGDGAFLRHGLGVVRYHPPFGLAGTKAWLGRIASVLGLEGSADAYARPLKARTAKIGSLRQECRHRTVALVGDPFDLELLTTLKRAFGFSVAELLGELGFHVRCLVYSVGVGLETRALLQPKVRVGEGTIEFVPFATQAQLDRQLGRGVDLVFSHFNHDPRLEAHGLLGFTEEAFEPGLDGLLRSGRRLLIKCAARPFPRHRAHLTPWTL